ncbi:uncharacterized protein LOC124316155 isoform X3 [Daphnia pulicaria]|uniref:uncharacterized protein LOC124316155 isoform X3 n=1 Tax=Daphnia pulicaria TaxID=35523 RepID=UPI001EECD018|nr:uncharacterized protein LOC124316155 isoform X3 [Daphnia pulicaria]
MWHLMWLTTLCFVCYLSAINYVVAAPIDSADEAAEYLERFGYLERGPQDSSYSQSVKAESFIDAIKDFQSFAGLKKTGELDKETLELINKPRCGVADRIRPSSSSTRRKRFAIQGSHWPKKQLTYKIKKYTEDMPKSDVDRGIARAFQMWADVTDLTFVHVNNELADVDIDILFASGEHGSCPSFNDGPGGTLAHATYPIYGGDAHFDDGETWTLDSVKAGTNLFQVATHEFGHSLGLEHTHVTTAVMYPFYGYSSDFKLDKDDIEGIQELYGKNQFSKKLALELEAILELLKTTVNNFEKKNIELRNDLIDTRTNLNKKLEETKQELVETRANTRQELEKTRADFIITVNDLSAKLNATKKELAETKMTARNVSTELKNLKVTEEKLKRDLRAISNDLKTAKTTLASTRTELNSTKSAVADLATKLNVQTSEIVDIGKMPTSCADLQQIGHKLSGFFSVKGSKKMEMIYCNFNANQNDKQKWIGYADVKSASVHFYVQRESSFYPQKTPIPFDLARVNEGNTMNLTSGIFTAPRPGIYYFSFTGVARLESSSYANFYSRLYLNGNIIGSSNVHENKGPVDQWSPLTLQSTLNLKKGDRVWMQISYSSSSSFMYDNIDHRTHFTGFMLDEEIVASL